MAENDPKPKDDAPHHAPPSAPLTSASAGPPPPVPNPPPRPRTAAEREAEIRRCANAAMERYAAGDESAFRELYHLVSDRLSQYLFRRTGDRARTDDLKQQTFLHMHQARARFIDGANVFPWMFQIAHHLLVDSIRRSGRDVSFDVLENEPVCPRGAADELLIGRELDQRLLREIPTLPESQQHAIDLRFNEGFTYREIAEAMATTVPAVTSLLHRAITTLERRLAGAQD